jgi:hypothetical protein
VKNIRTILLTVALILATIVSSTPAAFATSAALPTLTELRSARIKLSDLPGSYQRDYSPDDDSSSTSSSNDPVCSRKLDKLNSQDPDATAPRKAASKFRLDMTTGPFVSNSLGAWRSRGPAVAGLRQIRSLLRSCHRWTETDTDGTKATVRLSPLRLPALGSDRVGYRAKVTVRQGLYAVTVRADLAVVRVRNAVTIVAVLSFGASDVSLVDLAALSTDRLRAVD